MEPEIYFLKYAFPCSQVLKDIRKTITDKDYQILKKAAFNNEVLPRKYLEKVFEIAIERMKKINEDIWNINTIKTYFHEKHDDLISKDLPPTIRRLCKIRRGKVINIKKNVLIVNLGDEKRNVLPLYKNPRINDEVIIHYGYAVEKISNK